MSPAISPVAPSPTLPLSSRRPSVSFGGFGLRGYGRGIIQPRQDQDWFRLDVESDQAGYIKVTFDERSREPVRSYYARLALYDSSNSCMLGDCETDNGRIGPLKVYLDPGVYFLRVTGPGGDSLPTSAEVARLYGSHRSYSIAWDFAAEKAC